MMFCDCCGKPLSRFDFWDVLCPYCLDHCVDDADRVPFDLNEEVQP